MALTQAGVEEVEAAEQMYLEPVPYYHVLSNLSTGVRF